MPASKMLICHWLSPTTVRVSTSTPFSFLSDDGDGSIAAATRRSLAPLNLEKKERQISSL